MSLSSRTSQGGRYVPTVGIIGRPNVGKSTLFNILTRTRKALVKDEPGVTRDVQIGPVDWWGSTFDIVDTGGITEKKDLISQLIREQVKSVVSDFDLLLVLMDGKTGLVPEDRDLVRIAVESGRPFQLVVNKVDKFLKSDEITAEFHEFGMDFIPTSFEQSVGVDQVVEWIIANLPEKEASSLEGPRITVIGKPNVGKSSIINGLLGQKAVIVSPLAGTTVDATEHPFKFLDKPYILVDTAGLRRQARRKDGVEYLSAIQSGKALGKADIVLLMVDALEGPTDQDSKMLESILDQHKAVIVVANKYDVASQNIDEAKKMFREKLASVFHYYTTVPIVFTCALTGYGFKELFKKIDWMLEKLEIRIPTSQLNKFFYEVIRQAPAPVWGNSDVKFKYLVQTNQKPPSFIAFCNHPEGVSPSYRRFLTKRIQENWDLEGIPIRIFAMGGKDKE